MVPKICSIPECGRVRYARGWGRRVKNGWVNHCIHGHEFTLENTYINGQGRKVCRTCSAVSREKYTQRKALSNG